MVRPLSGTHSAPASPVNAPEMTKAIHRYFHTCTPTNSARVSLSRMACSALPKGELTITHMAAVATRKRMST